MAAKSLLYNLDSPIVRRVDENDVYKILMMYFIWKYYPNLEVTFGFKNRTIKIPLSKYVRVEEVREQCEEVAKMRFTDKVIAIYRSWGMFPEEFLQALKGIQLTMPLIERDGDSVRIEIGGNWFNETLWEMYILCIVSELFGRGYIAQHEISETVIWEELNCRLDEKIELFKANPLLRIMQFGLRRRFSGRIEEHVTERLVTEVPKIITGVSNMYLADKYGLEAQGTTAHEVVMAVTALMRHQSPEAMRQAPYKVLEQWQSLYGHKALIILDDAYGSDVFRAALPRHFLEDYRGFRHDSGDPIKYGEDTIALYKRNGIDPINKLIIFSDGLNPQKAVELLNHFKGRIKVAFGMGTNLTNDVGFVPPLSLVMKIILAAGNHAIKFSNNLNKAIGDASEREYYKWALGYTNTYRESVIY